MKKSWSILIALAIATNLAAQKNRYMLDERSNEGHALLFNFSYGLQWPGGDLSERFGYNFTTGGTVELMMKGNYIIGTQGTFQFGSHVKEDVLAGLRNEDGNIFGGDGALSEIKLRERGLYAGGHLGKLFSLSKTNKRAGLRVTVGAGMLQHKIKIQDDPLTDIPQLSGKYKKGYDRLSNGFAMTEFIGYQYLAQNRRVNFIAGFEFTQAFTQNQRSFDFDTRRKDDRKRTDLLTGFRLSWTLPLYLSDNPEAIRY